jgi:hypothetical protein
MVDVFVVGHLWWEFGACGSFGDAGVAAVASGRVGSFQDFGDGLTDTQGQSVRGKNPRAR